MESNLEKNKMQVLSTPIEDLYVLQPKVWEDERGYFFESYNQRFLQENGLEYTWVQDNEAKSDRGVLRGLHFQKGVHAQAKLVRVLSGEVLDVVVDLRPDSPTFGIHYSILLSGENKRQLLVPRGFAHGYIALQDQTVFVYKCDNFYNKEAEGGLRYDDPHFDIDWKLDADQFTIAEKDLQHPAFKEQDFTSCW